MAAIAGVPTEVVIESGVPTEPGVPTVSEVVAQWQISAPLSVAEAAELLGVSPHTVRYYERAGLLRVPRSASGHRRFDEAALRRLLFLIRMRSSGMPIGDLHRYVELVDRDASIAERRDMMLRHRRRILEQITELQAALAITDYKLETYGAP